MSDKYTKFVSEEKLVAEMIALNDGKFSYTVDESKPGQMGFSILDSKGRNLGSVIFSVDGNDEITGIIHSDSPKSKSLTAKALASYIEYTFDPFFGSYDEIKETLDYLSEEELRTIILNLISDAELSVDALEEEIDECIGDDEDGESGREIDYLDPFQYPGAANLVMDEFASRKSFTAEEAVNSFINVMNLMKENEDTNNMILAEKCGRALSNILSFLPEDVEEEIEYTIASLSSHKSAFSSYAALYASDNHFTSECGSLLLKSVVVNARKIDNMKIKEKLKEVEKRV